MAAENILPNFGPEDGSAHESSPTPPDQITVLDFSFSEEGTTAEFSILRETTGEEVLATLAYIHQNQAMIDLCVEGLLDVAMQRGALKDGTGLTMGGRHEVTDHVTVATTAHFDKDARVGDLKTVFAQHYTPEGIPTVMRTLLSILVDKGSLANIPVSIPVNPISREIHRRTGEEDLQVEMATMTSSLLKPGDF